MSRPRPITRLLSWFRSRDSTPDPRPVEDWSDYPSVRNGHARRAVEDNKDGRTP